MRGLSIRRTRGHTRGSTAPRCILAGLCGLVAAAVPLSAATVTFSILPVNGEGSVLDAEEIVVVSPGGEVPYILTALIICDTDIIDNDGLASFSIDIGTDLQVPQPPIDSLDPGIVSVFTVDQSKGISREGPVRGVDEDIVEIAARQNVRGKAKLQTGIALLQIQILGEGRLLTPEIEGDFTADILDSVAATVLWPNSSSVYEPQIAFGPPLRIFTRWPMNLSDISNRKTAEGRMAKGSNNAQTTTDTTTTTTALPWTTYVTLAAIVGGLIFVLIWGDGLLWLFGPLLAVILGVMLLLGQWPTLQ